MSIPSPLPGSLYELAANETPTAPFVCVSPATFKSLVGVLLNLLSERQLAALVWAKLPRGEVWQEELQHYRQKAVQAKGVYTFKSPSEEELEEASLGQVTTAATGGMVTMWLPAHLPLKREYFLLIWSRELQVGVVARRSRLRRATLPDSVAGEFEAVADSSNEDATDKRQTLELLCQFEPAMVRSLVHYLALLRSSPGEMATIPPVVDASAAADTPWQAQFSELSEVAPQSTLLADLLMRQLQHQEEQWQRANSYRKQAEQAELLDLQNKELLNTVRLRDDFLNNVGQELRTPLTTIKTALTLLSSSSLRPPQRQRYMDLIAKECDRQSSLITSLLELVQIDRSASDAVIEPLRLADIVPGVVSTYQPLAEEKGVMLAYTIPDDLPAIASISAWVKQIVINLVHNGIKFTPRGGQVWVRARCHDATTIHLEVRDTGIGIPSQEIPKIFDHFYRVRQAAAEDTGGAGLGLTIVQQLLIHSGGSIQVRSRLGEGSTFTVTLPIYRE